ncbi:MAG: 4-(cytidine 5'-diphospho)-2-C-methyl-D-erythritol kinase [Actinomycetota bacterium]|nr:4-(cytidine 5'-diphospho)-2-C-methyl-D-erythritol kinase [Actinomycetota bacterium]
MKRPTTTLFAPAKLTLSLRCVGLRSDGLHLIDAEMVTLDLYDELEIDPTGTGLILEGASSDVVADDDNLVARALRLAERTAGVRLRKRIPSQAGLGGGSADAAAVLRWARFGNRPGDLQAAAGIGADVAFCLIGGRAQVTGIGEVITPLPFVAQTFTLLTPPVACPTPAVYRAWDELGGPTNDESPNDLEAAALHVAPELARFRDALGDATGVRPTLAGSGSSWFVPGSFPGADRAVVRTTPAGWSPTQHA